MRFEVLLGPTDGEYKGVAIDKVTIGRGTDDTIAFPFARMISRRHVEVVKDGRDYYIVDLGPHGDGSKNGTCILKKDGSEIEIWEGNLHPPLPGEKVSIEPGDIIILGRSIWLKFLGD